MRDLREFIILPKIISLITTNNGIDGKFTILELIQDYNVNINLFINNNIKFKNIIFNLLLKIKCYNHLYA